jgi:plastocyanin
MCRRAIHTVVTAAVLVALLTHPAGAAAAAVTIQNFAFSPQTLTVAPGTTVTWTMKDSPPTQHTVTSDDGSWGSQDLSLNQTYSHTFSSPGTYGYHCSIHSYMTGTITVSGATPTPTPTHHTTPTPTPTHHATTQPTVQSTPRTSTTPTRAPGSATPRPTSAGTTAAVDTPTSSPTTSVLAEPADRTASKRSAPWLVIVVIVVLAAGAGGIVFVRLNRAR